MTLTFAQLVEHVATHAGTTKKDADWTLRVAFGAIADQAEHGNRVTIPGFGVFSRRTRKSRKVRNPATGETIKIKASKSVRFKVGKELKEAVNSKKRGR